MIYYPGVILQARPRPLFWKEDRKQSSDLLVLFKCWYLKERSRYGDFGVKWGQTWGGPRPAIPWYLKTQRKHCYFQLKYTLVSPDSNNRIYADFFSEQPHQVPVLIIDQEKTTPSTPYKKVQDRILELPLTAACACQRKNVDTTSNLPCCLK